MESQQDARECIYERYKGFRRIQSYQAGVCQKLRATNPYHYCEVSAHGRKQVSDLPRPRPNPALTPFISSIYVYERIRYAL